MHIHLGETYCLEVFITEGEAEEVLNFVSRIRAIKGISLRESEYQGAITYGRKQSEDNATDLNAHAQYGYQVG
jgi:hypothetical protein